MYEPEVNNATEPVETLSAEVRLKFAEHRGRVTARTMLPWGENCTECVWPVCYTTCALYERRADGACRQFIGPAVRIDHRAGLNPYILKVRFKQWAKMWAVGTLALKPLDAALRSEQIHIAVGAIARAAPLPAGVKTRVLGKINYKRRMAAEHESPGQDGPDCFLLEVYNPDARTAMLTLTVRRKDRSDPRHFEDSIVAAPGYTRSRIAFADIARAVDLSRPFEVEIVPNQCEGRTLYFGLMDFVKERAAVVAEPATPPASRTFKCVVWDLDNTLWDGVLLEDGPAGIRPRPDVAATVRALDERGILNSIASKNHDEDALKVLRALNLEEYFLFPEIGWNAKSESIRRIVGKLNIGLESIAFVDDQAFEREEVKASLPGITVMDVPRHSELLERPECQVTVTAESRARRQMYREQEQRDAIRESCGGGYLEFLRACGMEVKLRPLSEENLKRVYELAQRTNQMNFSGSRYQEPELRAMLDSPALKGCVVECRDRFGEYGIVGFAVVDTTIPRLNDLMFSCRVQAKRVEHAVLGWLIARFAGGRDFYARYRRTERNTPSGKVFEEMGFAVAEENDNNLLLVFRSECAIPDDGLVRVASQMEAANVSS